MHQTGRFYEEQGPVSGYFGKNVLDLDKMRDYMSDKAYNAVLASVKFGEKLDRSVSDEIASGMKKWAIENGATHYTHLFQPLTDSTAEKHESFVSVKDGKAVEKFNGSALVQQHKLWEKGYIHRIISKVMFCFDVMPVNINHIAECLECVEGNAYWKQQNQGMHLRPTPQTHQRIIHCIYKEVKILKHK